MGIFIVIFIVGCLVVVGGLLKDKREKVIKEVEKISLEISKYESNLVESNFIVSKKIFNNKIYGLYIDDLHKNWSVYSPNISEFKIYKYDELLEVEVYENGNSIVSSKIGSALVGGILFGGVGAIIGASGKRDIESKCTSLQLRIRINNLENPEIVIPFITNEVLKSSKEYIASVENMKAFVATIGYLQNNI